MVFLTSECENWLSHKNTKYIPALHAECNFTNNEDLITQTATEILENPIRIKLFTERQKQKSRPIKKLETANFADLEILEKELA